jgi:hypothetical protein
MARSFRTRIRPIGRAVLVAGIIALVALEVLFRRIDGSGTPVIYVGVLLLGAMALGLWPLSIQFDSRKLCVQGLPRFEVELERITDVVRVDHQWVEIRWRPRGSFAERRKAVWVAVADDFVGALRAAVVVARGEHQAA